MGSIRRRLLMGAGGMPSNVGLVGGRIFYIGSDNGVTYRFFDQNQVELTTITVAGLANAYYVWRSGTPTADRFYVVRDLTTIYSSKWVTSGTFPYAFTATAIGTGKSTTNTLLSSGYSYFGEMVNALRSARSQGLNGCYDWYFPSQDEALAFANSGLASTSMIGNTGGSQLWTCSTTAYPVPYCIIYYSTGSVRYAAITSAATNTQHFTFIRSF